MKDPSIPNSEDKKKLMFYDTEKRQADLRIRLKFDGLNQSQFFRALITGYLERDEGILNFLNKFKKTCGIHNTKKRSGSKKLIEQGYKNENMFALNSEEVEDIFDILEECSDL